MMEEHIQNNSELMSLLLTYHSESVALNGENG